jgi:hypothetical protein
VCVHSINAGFTFPLGVRVRVRFICTVYFMSSEVGFGRLCGVVGRVRVLLQQDSHTTCMRTETYSFISELQFYHQNDKLAQKISVQLKETVMTQSK